MTARHANALHAFLAEGSFEGEVSFREPMARHTSFRIGGPAQFYVKVSTVGALSRLVELCENENTPWEIVGKGSNLLVSDEGYAGVILTLGDEFRTCVFDEERSCFIVGAGYMLGALVQEAYKRSLAGLEFAVGTPGTLGGAVRMNAGSREDWIGSRIISVTTLIPGEGLKRYCGQDIEWGYRTSSFLPGEIIIECEIAVKTEPETHIRGKMEAQLSKRKKNQPLNMPSCGSVFKNPPEHSAGALIEEAGFKGFRIGGAQVSEIHANFIVNTGGAKAADVRELMALIQEKVTKAYGIELQPEVRFLGFSEE